MDRVVAEAALPPHHLRGPPGATLAGQQYPVTVSNGMGRSVPEVGSGARGGQTLPSTPTLRGIAMSHANDWNAKIIEEFRANGGRVGGQFEGAPLLLLHTTGAKTGKERVHPLMYQDIGEGRVAVFASKGGAPDNPDWFHNVSADPTVEAEIGTERKPFRARIAAGEERDQIWSKQKAEFPGFAEYEEKTDRIIPVVVLDPA